jgi:hypothetical protein
MRKIILEFDEQRYDNLLVLQAKARANSVKELFESDLSLLSWALDQLYNGRIPASVDEETGLYREVQMPVLDRVKRAIAEG